MILVAWATCKGCSWSYLSPLFESQQVSAFGTLGPLPLKSMVVEHLNYLRFHLQNVSIELTEGLYMISVTITPLSWAITGKVSYSTASLP